MSEPHLENKRDERKRIKDVVIKQATLSRTYVTLLSVNVFWLDGCCPSDFDATVATAGWKLAAAHPPTFLSAKLMCAAVV